MNMQRRARTQLPPGHFPVHIVGAAVRSSARRYYSQIANNPSESLLYFAVYSPRLLIFFSFFLVY